ncbi:MAG TPA: hypothetical protein VF740_01510 [Candidatus Acidoferrum sp.]
MTRHLWDRRLKWLASEHTNENTWGWKFYYKRFRRCFLVHRIQLHASANGDCFVR